MKRKCIGAVGVVTIVIIGCSSLKPEAPVPIYPNEDNLHLSSVVNFQWKSTEGATSYNLEIYKDSALQSPVFVDPAISDTHLTVDAFKLALQGFYYWRVAAYNEYGRGEWSEPLRFIRSDFDWPPKLILPFNNDLYVTYPRFIWSSHPLAKSYLLRICKKPFPDGEILLEDTLHDTTYEFSLNDWKRTSSGEYLWSVAPLPTYTEQVWSEPRCFLLTKEFDLDTTYYPLGFGYEWCYEKYSYWYHWDAWDGDQYGASYDTINIRVEDSICTSEGWVFYLSGGGFEDVDSRIENDKIEVSWNHYSVGSLLIPLIPQSSSYGDGYMVLTLDYIGDTLSFKMVEPGDEWTNGGEGTKTSLRLIGVGAVEQTVHIGNYYHRGEGRNYHLLWFYNGRDTVYKAK